MEWMSTDLGTKVGARPGSGSWVDLIMGWSLSYHRYRYAFTCAPTRHVHTHGAWHMAFAVCTHTARAYPWRMAHGTSGLDDRVPRPQVLSLSMLLGETFSQWCMVSDWAHHGWISMVQHCMWYATQCKVLEGPLSLCAPALCACAGNTIAGPMRLQHHSVAHGAAGAVTGAGARRHVPGRHGTAVGQLSR